MQSAPLALQCHHLRTEQTVLKSSCIRRVNQPQLRDPTIPTHPQATTRSALTRALSARGFALSLSPRALAKGHRRSHSKSRYELGESTEERPASELGLGGMWEVPQVERGTPRYPASILSSSIFFGLQCPVRSGLGCVLCCLRSGPIPIRGVGWISPTCSPFPVRVLLGSSHTERRKN